MKHAFRYAAPLIALSFAPEARATCANGVSTPPYEVPAGTLYYDLDDYGDLYRDAVSSTQRGSMTNLMKIAVDNFAARIGNTEAKAGSRGYKEADQFEGGTQFTPDLFNPSEGQPRGGAEADGTMIYIPSRGFGRQIMVEINTGPLQGHHVLLQEHDYTKLLSRCANPDYLTQTDTSNLDAGERRQQTAIIEREVKSKTFASLSIGQTLAEALSVLERQGYVQDPLDDFRHEYRVFSKNFKYKIDCGTDSFETDVTSPDNRHEIRVKICDANSGLRFSRVDQNGIKYTVSFDVTPVPTMDARAALTIARVYQIEGTVKPKILVTPEYMESLADQRYGKTRRLSAQSGTIPKYFASHDPGTEFEVGIGDTLFVKIVDGEYLARIRDPIVAQLLGTTQRAIEIAPKPNF